MLFHHCPGGKLWLLPFINFCSVTIVLLLCEIIFFFTPQVPKVTHTEFCQGRTMRWALAWSFYDDMMAPVSLCILFCCHGLPWPTILPVFFLNGSCLHISKNPEATSELCTSSAAHHLSPGCNPLSSSHVPLEALIFCSGDTFIWFSVFFLTHAVSRQHLPEQDRLRSVPSRFALDCRRDAVPFQWLMCLRQSNDDGSVRRAVRYHQRTRDECLYSALFWPLQQKSSWAG